MKISASIYCYPKDKPVKEIVSELDAININSFHIDCDDNIKVFEDIAEIRKYTKTPIDLHIISEEPEKFYDGIIKYDVDYVQFQYEPIKDNKINPPRTGKTIYGLSIVTETPIEVFDEYNDFDFIMFMATIPGKSGGVFDKINFRRIQNFRQKYQNKEIFVDGGINGEVSFILRNMGVSLIVVGSYLLYKTPSPQHAILDFRLNNIESEYQVGDFMIERKDLPVLSLNEANLSNILQTIEKYKLGFVLFSDENDKFVGIISNADVRKGLLKNLDNLNQTTLDVMINKTPVIINESDTVAHMLQLIKEKNFIISYLPVINNQNNIVGAITFFNLIRSEL